MAYQVTNGAPAQRALTTDETARLKAHMAARQDLYAGKSAAQIAVEMNAPRTVQNPAPGGRVPRAAVAKADLQNLLTALVLGLMKSGSPLLAQYQFLLAQVNALSGDTCAVAGIQRYIDEAKADGLITQDLATALTTDPDPAYQPTIQAGPMAFEVLGEVALEPADVQGAMAS